MILIPDDDPAGAAYASQVRQSLSSRQIEHTVLNLSGTGAKDVSDFIAGGKTAEDLVTCIGSEWIRATAPTLEEHELEEA